MHLVTVCVFDLYPYLPTRHSSRFFPPGKNYFVYAISQHYKDSDTSSEGDAVLSEQVSGKLNGCHVVRRWCGAIRAGNLNRMDVMSCHPKVMRCYQSRQVGNGMDVMSSVGDVVLWKIMSCHPKLMWYYQSRQLGNGMDVMSCQGIISCIMLAWLKNGKFWENPFWDEISCQCPMTLLR